VFHPFEHVRDHQNPLAHTPALPSCQAPHSSAAPGSLRKKYTGIAHPPNIVDSVDHIASRVWQDDEGRNQAGAVLIQEQRVFAARAVQKADARPGGYVATGGHGGILGAAEMTDRLFFTICRPRATLGAPR
jgi:hypothetical protein